MRAGAVTASHRSTDRIDIGVEDAAGPWSEHDGTGYANEVVIAAFRAAGVDAHLVVLPYARCKRMVMEGELPACFSMSVEPELHETIRFSAQPLFTFSAAFFVRADDTSLHSIEDLPRGAVVGTVLGYEYPSDIRARLARREIRLDPAPTESANLRKVSAGRLLATIVTENDVKPAAWVAGRAVVPGRVVRAFSVGTTPSFIGFSVKNPRGRELAGRFDDGFRRITANGELNRIRERWIARTRPGPKQ
jgi:ABC-type amino acid transport substrate-binding protein